jgi:hypothetical protein
MSESTLPVVNSVWVGHELGPIHAACLRSFVRNGHKTVLYVYQTPNDVPKGVKLADARTLMPESSIIRDSKYDSVTLFADLFRYEILRAELGLYVDCDVYCLRPIQNADFIFGWESSKHINNAVLKLPPDCPVLSKLCKIKETGWTLSKKDRRWWVQRLFRRPLTLAEMPLTTTGPRALTKYARCHGLDRLAAPLDVFYPVSATHVGLLLDRDLTLDDLTTSRSLTVHLYNSWLHQCDLSNIPSSSPLGAILGSHELAQGRARNDRLRRTPVAAPMQHMMSFG